jgi:hypothetical protein
MCMNRDGKARLRILGLGMGLFAGCLVAPALAQDTKPAPAAPATQPAAETAPLPKAEEILDRFVKESGGEEAYKKVKSIVLNGQLLLPMDMKGSMKIYVVRPAKMLSEVEIPNMGVMRSGSDGETVWSDNPMQGPRLLEGQEKEMTLEGSRISDEANWRERYTKVETKALADVKGKPAYKVEMTSKTGQTRFAFYDKESGLLVKQMLTMKSEMGDMEMEIFVTDYKKVGDILMPHKSTTAVMGQEMSTVFEKIEVNVDVPEEKFALPAEVKELKAQKDKKPEAKPETKPEAKPEPKGEPGKK